MNHIELVGPSGSGKSTIHSELITHEKLFGGVREDAYQRLRKEEAVNNIQKYLLEFTPRRVQPLLTHQSSNHFKYSAFNDFVSDHPEFVGLVAKVMETSHTPLQEYSVLKKAVEQYQLGTETVIDSEILFLDDSFVFRGVTTLWRDEKGKFDLAEYFNTIPVPDLVIHLTAPIDICLERQRKRGRFGVEQKWTSKDYRTLQEELQKDCEEVCRYLKKKTDVITIQNGDGINSTVGEILKCLNIDSTQRS